MEAGELKSGNLSCSQMKATLSCIWGHSLAAAEGLWDRFASQFTQKTVKHPQKVMVWGCFSWKSRGGLEFLRQGEMMNTEQPAVPEGA